MGGNVSTSSPLNGEKFLEFILLLKIKISFSPLQYELLSRIDIQKLHFKVLLDVDKNKVMIDKSKLDSNFSPMCRRALLWKNEIGRKKGGENQEVGLHWLSYCSLTSFPFLWEISLLIKKWKTLCSEWLYLAVFSRSVGCMDCFLLKKHAPLALYPCSQNCFSLLRRLILIILPAL